MMIIKFTIPIKGRDDISTKKTMKQVGYFMKSALSD